MTKTIKKTMSANEAMERLKNNDATKNLPEILPIQKALQNKIVSLGTDEVFALRDNDGEIRAFRQQITLSAENGTLVQPVYNGPYVVSAQGYEIWAEAAGANVIFPDQVLVGDRWQLNPHAIYDENNGRIKAVHARAVAFRFSSKGIPQVSDWSTIFDTASYRMIDLIGKAKKFPQAFKLLPTGQKPDEDGTWGEYVFDDAMTLWVNSSHEEALQWYGQIINREKKAIDFAQTFARRNAVKHLSGIQRAPGPTWNLSVLCWRPTSGNIVKWDATQYIAMQKKVGNLIHAQDAFQTKQIEAHTGHEHMGNLIHAQDAFQTKQIEAHTGHEHIGDESGFAVLDSELDPEDQKVESQFSNTPEQSKLAPQQSKSKEFSDDDHNALQAIAIFQSDPEFSNIYHQACDELKINSDNDHDPDTARLLLRKIERLH